MIRNATEASKCSEKGEAEKKFKASPRRKQQARFVRIIKAGLAFILKRPIVFRWAIVHLPGAVEAVATWGKEAISHLCDIF